MKKPDPLRDIFEQRLDSLASQATRSDEALAAGEIEAIAGLAKLIELRDSLRPKSRNWWPASVLAVTLAAVSVLLFVRLRETEIELDAQSTEVAFELGKDQMVTAALNLAALGVSGLRSFDLPAPLESGAGATAVSFALTSKPSAGSVTLAPLLLPAGTRFSVRRSENPRQFLMSIDARALTLQAALDGPVRIGFAGAPARDYDFPSPKAVTLIGEPGETELDLTFPAMPQMPISPQLQVKDLSAARIDRFLTPDRTVVAQLSAILSGTLYFESLDGGKRSLRAGEELRFEHSNGELRSMALTDKNIAWKFYGKVDGMTTGAGQSRRSLMPSTLEWLKARHGLTLLWATSLYLFALIAGALRWWGIRV